MSRATKKRKRGYYTGALAEPIEWAPPILPPGKFAQITEDWPSKVSENWRTAVERAQQEDARNRELELCASVSKLVTLTEHFSVDRSRPGWSRNLALSLAQRHEPGLKRRAGVFAYAELFAMYGIDPDQPDADFPLALALAQQHVPGMRFKPPEPRQSRLSTTDLIRFTLAVVAVYEHLEQTTGRSSDRKVVAILRDPRRLQKIVVAAVASEVTRLIQSGGNGGRFERGPLSDRAIRSYLRQMRTALPDTREGRATTFQQQFVCEVLPFIFTAARIDAREPGQI